MDSNNAYIYGPSTAPIEQVDLSSGTITYLASDRLGSVRGTINASGTLTHSTSYDAWGNPQTSGGLTSNTPLGYAGNYTDPTGLTYNIRRYYDPTTGQFISVDPAVDQTEAPYAYVNGDPVDGVDPLGLWGWNPIDDAESAWNSVNPVSSSNVFYGIASRGGIGATILGLNPLLPAAADFVGAANACSSGAEAEGILAGLGWTVLGAFDPEADEADVAAEELGPRFAPGRWLEHFDKHGAEFGSRNSVEYLNGARDLVGREGVDTYTRANGDRLFYDQATNEFAAMRSDGVLRTYFRPKDGVDFWKGQTGG